MRVCVACSRPIRRHDKYVVLALDTFKHRLCVTPTEYDWRYLPSVVTIPQKEWQVWVRTGLDMESCGGR